ncbi:rhodanese-like domain-containing protein [Cellulomonas chengniuliangii]|uniref:rhodanese-like domain-containing protein n=1 Tax=Cellulomonas chengniuliangii TaxID=2968084 RepID=UPI001D0ED0B4|nr:rhodanese-like domain-containing protein [Cellulomonas chengniuliangii]MCC2317977.1 rhodanese-like domain-containing protein [Cellulomonas chengniuliangii]
MDEIDTTRLHALLEQDPSTPVVDVREDHEYAHGHIPGAVSVPLSELVARHAEIGALPGTVYLVCEVGGRSGQAAAWLEGQGYDVVNVAGGTSAWRHAGLPLE